MTTLTELTFRVKTEGVGQLTQLQNQLQNLAKQATATNVNFNEVSAELRRIQSTSVNSVNNLKGYASAWREIANSVDIASQEFKQATLEADKLDRQIAKTRGGAGAGIGRFAKITGAVAAGSVFGGVEGALGAGVGGVFGGPAGAAAGAAIGAQVSQIRQVLAATATYSAELEKQRIALRQVAGSSDNYQQALKFIAKTSEDLAIPQDVLIKNFTQLSASVIGAGGNIENAKTAFIGIASGIRGTGGSLEALDAALLATSQVFSKGKVSAEELRGQIGERLPGAFTLFANAIGKTPQELDKALQEGQVSLVQFETFTKALFKRYGDAAEIIARSPENAGQRLETALKSLSDSVGTLLRPIGAAFQNTFADIVKFIDAGIRKLVQFFGLTASQREATARTKINIEKGLIQEYEQIIAKGQFDRTRSKSTVELLLKQSQARLIAAQSEVASLTTPTQPPGTGLGAGTGTTGVSKSAAAAAAREAAQDLKEKNRQNRELRSLQIQNDLLYYKEKQYTTDLQIIQATSENNQNEVDRLEKVKIADIFEQKIFNIVREKNKALQESADNEDQTNRALRDQAIQQKSANALLEARLDVVAAIAKVDTEADIRRKEQNLELGRLTENRAAALGIISKKEFEALELEREKVDIAKRFGSANQDLINDYIALIEKQAELKDSITFNFVQPLRQAYEDSQNLGQSLGNTAVSAVNGLSDAFVNFAATGKASFSEFARSVLLDLSRIFARFAILQAIGFVLPGLNFGGGGGGGGLSNLNAPASINNPLGILNAKGNVFAANGIVPYAMGGIIDKPTIFPFAKGIGLMGEAGPEAIMPLKRGADGKLGVAGGGTTNVVVNVDAKGSNVQGDNTQGAALGRAISTAVQAELIKQKRPGGLLA